MTRICPLLTSCLLMSPLAGFSQETKSFSVVNLQNHFTPKLTKKFGNDDREGNFLKLADRKKKLGGILFNITDGVIQLGNKVWVEMPTKVEGIPVNKNFVRLYILHATGYGGGPNKPGMAWYVEDGTRIGEYRIHFADRSSETIPIVYGIDVRDWWFRQDEAKTTRSKIVWEGEKELAKKYDCRLRLYLTTWTNPKPQTPVIAVDYCGRKQQTVAAPFCVAMTVQRQQ